MSDQTASYVGQLDFASGTDRYNIFEFIFQALAGKMATATLVQVLARS